jgi:hypothetical protein
MNRRIPTFFLALFVPVFEGCSPRSGNSGMPETGQPVVMRARSTGASRFEILLGGDTYFGETYPGAVGVLKARGYGCMLEGLRSFMDSADWTVLNLEAPLTATSKPSWLAGRKDILHRGDPILTPRVLREGGLRVVSLANNHSLDDGMEGLDETARRLRDQGIDSFGAGINRNAACRPWIGEFELGGRRQFVALLGGLEYYRAFDRQTGYYATANRGGVANLNEKWLPRLVGDLRKRYPGIFIIAFPHWGNGNEWKTPRQESAAAFLLDSGVDLVLGHGVHHMQAVERVKGRWVVYSLGNFMFGSRGEYEKLPAPPFSLVAVLTFDAGGDRMRPSLKLYPILSDNTQTGYQPRPVNEVEFRTVLRLLAGNSSGRSLPLAGMDRLGHYLQPALEP